MGAKHMIKRVLTDNDCAEAFVRLVAAVAAALEDKNGTVGPSSRESSVSRPTRQKQTPRSPP